MTKPGADTPPPEETAECTHFGKSVARHFHSLSFLRPHGFEVPLTGFLLKWVLEHTAKAGAQLSEKPAQRVFITEEQARFFLR